MCFFCSNSFKYLQGCCLKELLHCLCVWQGKPPDWQDFIGIAILLLINSTISFVEENNASNAAAALMARLAPKAKVLEVDKCFLLFFGLSIQRDL